MARSDIAPFYAPYHRGDEFGVRRWVNGAYTPPHRGYDIKRHAEGTPIPSIIGGVVVRNERSSALGWFVTVQGQGVWDGEFVAYSHLRIAGKAVGQIIELGDFVGELGNTGSMTTGPHVHITRHPYGTHPGTAPVKDPWFLIAAALSAPAGGGVTPINPNPQEDVMNEEQEAKLDQALERTNRIHNALFGNTEGTGQFTGIQVLLSGAQAVGALSDDEAHVLDALRREARGWRLFHDISQPDYGDREYVAVNFNLPASDPRQVIYLSAAEANSLRNNYQMLADTTSQAPQLDATGIATLIRLAKGTDQVYGA